MSPCAEFSAGGMYLDINVDDTKSSFFACSFLSNQAGQWLCLSNDESLKCHRLTHMCSAVQATMQGASVRSLTTGTATLCRSADAPSPTIRRTITVCLYHVSRTRVILLHHRNPLVGVCQEVPCGRTTGEPGIRSRSRTACLCPTLLVSVRDAASLFTRHYFSHSRGNAEGVCVDCRGRWWNQPNRLRRLVRFRGRHCQKLPVCKQHCWCVCASYPFVSTQPSPLLIK